MSASPSAIRANIKISRSTSPELPTSPTDADDTKKAVKTILKSRKCWRSMKGREEAVWPPELEAALIEGLEKYRPAESKSTRVLGRFPMRNKFVADHIFDVTGQRRTPKQVGSRIQQLRDTSSGKHILKAISDKHYEMMYPKLAKSEDPEAGPSSLAGSPSIPLVLPPMSPSHVYIPILSPNTTWTASTSYPVPLAGLPVQEPRPLRAFDPTVTFMSPGQTPCQSVFQVFRDGHLVHHELAPVSVCSGPVTDPLSPIPMFMYSTSLVPQWWQHLCECDDLSAYTVYQEVTRMPFAPGPSNVNPVLLSVIYHFIDASPTFRTPTPPLSPRSSADPEFTFSDGSSPSTDLDSVLSNTPPLLPSSGDSVGIPDLAFTFDDDYSLPPPSPLDVLSALDTQSSWDCSSAIVASYPPPFSPSCDPYLDAAALFDAFVYQ